MSAQAKEAPLNVVMIVVDDLGYNDVGLWSKDPKVKTPAMDRLFREGVSFNAAYVTSPICNASRIGLMTGAYQQRFGTYWYTSKGLPADVPTLGEMFQEKGYRTGYVGKFHYGATNKSTDGRDFPMNHGFETFFGFSGGTKHYLRHRDAYSFKGDMVHQGALWDGKKRLQCDGFLTEMFGVRARNFINEQSEKPYFLMLSFNAVHNYVHQLPDGYLKAHKLPKLADFQPKDEKYWHWRKKIGFPNDQHGRDYYRGQLHLLDKEIDKVLAEVGKNTVVVLLSDNGGSLVTYANNIPLKGGKYTLDEGGVRVPMVVRWPGKKARTVEQPVMSTDLFATFSKVLTHPGHAKMDGTNLIEAIDGKLLAERPLFWATHSEQAVRQGKWKLVHTDKPPNSRLQIVDSVIGWRLYDLSKDIGEMNNLLEHNPEVVAELKQKLVAWQREMKKGN
ncbi:sulfatase-like hydrolase/transferase [Verrucomicrobiaceae bacterium N1E253]|uniref:Sulfatase-like hydrolase/transferase n=1 Tax=Oceaniferula marina TaxID=2748318 RepID=A0A851GHB7_9BACT|nr:sulfatase-like hydrolase/transferase [Oceaniferula marina]NWK55251.1 sulfatase-like hydrolase/transferase [Oceaniferula marina]